MGYVVKKQPVNHPFITSLWICVLLILRNSKPISLKALLNLFSLLAFEMPRYSTHRGLL